MGRPTTRSMQRARRPGARPASPHFREVEGEVEADQARDAFLSHAGREPTQMAYALGLTDGATRASVVSRLQQTQGNAYVQRLVQATLQVQRDKTKAKPPPPPPQFAVDGDGFINRVSDGMRVGRQDDSGAFVAVDASGKHIVPWLEAGVGSLSLSADQAGASFILGGSILRMKAAQVKPVAAAADATAATETQVNVKLTGTAIGMLFDEGSGLLGGKMLSWGGKWTPVAPEATPERVKTRLTAQSRIALEGGEFWTLMDYRLRDEKTSKQRWVAAGHPLISAPSWVERVETPCRA